MIYRTGLARLRRHGQLTGRLSVDVGLEPPVEHVNSSLSPYGASLGCRRDGATINRQNPSQTAVTAHGQIYVRYRRTTR